MDNRSRLALLMSVLCLLGACRPTVSLAAQYHDSLDRTQRQIQQQVQALHLNASVEADASGLPLISKVAGRPVDPTAAEYYKSRSLFYAAERAWVRAQILSPPTASTVDRKTLQAALDETYPYTSGGDGITFLPGHKDDTQHVTTSEIQSLRDGGVPWSTLLAVVNSRINTLGQDRNTLVVMGLDAEALNLIADFVATYYAANLKLAARISDDLDKKMVRVEHVVGADYKFFVNDPTGTHPARVEGMQAPYFEDATERSGLPEIRHESLGQVTDQMNLSGGGIALADFDGDGLLDVLVMGNPPHLFRQVAPLKFEDVTEKAGIAVDGVVVGGSWADYDNSGHPSIFLAGIQRNYLFKNLGDGRFKDVTKEAGLLQLGLASRTAAWFDYNRDGLLDLYLVNYGYFGRMPPHFANARNGQPDKLYKNNGDGTFTEVTDVAGTNDPGWGLCVGVCDYDNSGWPSIYVGNDHGMNTLYKNLGDGTFRNVAQRLGVSDKAHTMGCAWADFNDSGCFSLYDVNIKTVTTIFEAIWTPGASGDTAKRGDPELVVHARASEDNRLWVNNGDGTFTEAGPYLLDQANTGWGWDAKFLDFTDEGHQGIYECNGTSPGFLYANNHNVLYHYDGQRFRDVTEGSGADIKLNSRGMGIGDLDGDGYPDIITNNLNAKPTLLRNLCAKTGNHWIGFRFKGSKSNRDGIGSVIHVRTGTRVQTRQYFPCNGYQSCDAPEVLVGLGQATTVDEATIQWPSGARQTFPNLKPDRRYLFDEAKGIIELSGADWRNLPAGGK